MVSDKIAKNIAYVAMKEVRKRHHPMPPHGIFSAFGRGHELLIQPVPEEKVWKIWRKRTPKEYKAENVAFMEVSDNMWIMYIDGLWYQALS